MGRNILIVSILVALMVIILSLIVMQNKLVPDAKLPNIINSTNHENLINTNPIHQDTERATTLDPNENIGSIASLPNKCLGSALCPD
ncbi:MAG TPA: hypothetical protein VH481_05520 [Nitrososphaeraceae archaeon]